MENTILAELKTGPRKDGKGNWTGLQINAVVNGVKYDALIFSKDYSINPNNAVQFSNILVKK